MPRWPLILGALALLASAPALAADATQPHPHQGVFDPFTVPEKPSLTAEDLTALAKGEPVMKQVQSKEGDASGGRGIAVQDIHATPEQIWAQIVDYPTYPEMVGDVHECEIYEQKGEHIKVRFVIGAFFVSVEYFIDHTLKKDAGYMTWTLDYTRESDLDDSVGFWIVEPLADKPGWTRVFYSVDVQLRGWVPSAIESMLARSGLTKATSWVKRESEAAAGR